MATAQQVSQFRLANQSLVALALRDLSAFWGALNLAGSPVAVRDALLEYFPELLTLYSDTAAVLAGDFYDELRNVPASSARFAALLAEPTDPEVARADARWALGPLFQAEPDPLQVFSNLEGVTHRLILQSGRDTIANSAFRDPVRTGYARIPGGLTTCKWCVMLASRGAVYGSAASAGAEGNKYHSHCDCVPTPVRSFRDLPEEYDIREYQRLYAEGEGIAA